MWYRGCSSSTSDPTSALTVFEFTTCLLKFVLFLETGLEPANLRRDAIHPLTLLVELCFWERTALSRRVRKRYRAEGHSKSSSYSYSSRSRLQCGVGISKKCLFVSPSSLEMCCPKGLKGLSYLHKHTEGKIIQTQSTVILTLVNVLKDNHVKGIVWHLVNILILQC